MSGPVDRSRIRWRRWKRHAHSHVSLLPNLPPLQRGCAPPAPHFKGLTSLRSVVPAAPALLELQRSPLWGAGGEQEMLRRLAEVTWGCGIYFSRYHERCRPEAQEQQWRSCLGVEYSGRYPKR